MRQGDNLEVKLLNKSPLNGLNQKMSLITFISMMDLRNRMKFVSNFSPFTAQCVYTQSHAYMTKIPMTYHEAPTTNFRLF